MGGARVFVGNKLLTLRCRQKRWRTLVQKENNPPIAPQTTEKRSRRKRGRLRRLQSAHFTTADLDFRKWWDAAHKSALFKLWHISLSMAKLPKRFRGGGKKALPDPADWLDILAQGRRQ